MWRNVAWRHVTSRDLMSCYVTSSHVRSRRVTSCQAMSHHVTSCHVMSCHVTSRRVTSRRVMSCHVVSRSVLSFNVMSRRVTSCLVVSLHVVLCRFMSCHTVSCRFMLCHVVWRHVTSCHVVSRHVMSRHVMPCHVKDKDKNPWLKMLQMYKQSLESRRTVTRPMLYCQLTFSTQNSFNFEITVPRRVPGCPDTIPHQPASAGIYSSYRHPCVATEPIMFYWQFIFIFLFFIQHLFSETTKTISAKFSGNVYSGVVWIIR